MKIYDCFMFSDEKMLLDIRLNVLNDYVDQFVIIESKYKHNGDIKNKNFDINQYSKFKNKIKYIYLDEEPEGLVSISGEDDEDKKNKSILHNTYVRENYQRDVIAKGILDAGPEDFIIVGDIDEIPNLKNLDFENKKNHLIIFRQKMFYYKLNLYYKELVWTGTRACLKKNLKSPQWLRDLKFKKYPFWRIDKPKNLQIIENGGWHFAYMQTPEKISKKIKSFSHGEYNTLDFTDEKKIEEKMKSHEDIFNRGFSYKKVEIDHTFPKYIVDNKEKLKEWIV